MNQYYNELYIILFTLLSTLFNICLSVSYKKESHGQRIAFPGNSRSFNQISSTPNRNLRFLPLFTVVRFPNEACLTPGGETGSCISVSECLGNGGAVGGPCASNFGVCCIFMSTCGQTLLQRRNCTYFVNSGYPGPHEGSGACRLTLRRTYPDICQYRLDFEEFRTAGPEPVNHVCDSDRFTVSGAGPVPPICGQNDGSHIYLDAGPSQGSQVTLSFITGGYSNSTNPPSTKWKIRICQIPCSSNYKADEGCLQYYSGVSGRVKSFNYDPLTGLQLSNQDYTICIRSEKSFCSIRYTTCLDEYNNRSHAFTLTGNTLGQNPVSGSTGAACTADWLVAPCLTSSGNGGYNQDSGNDPQARCVDRICGGTLNSDGSTMLSPVTSSVRPFRLFFHTNNVEAPNDMGNRGFCLDYRQQPCIDNV